MIEYKVTEEQHRICDQSANAERLWREPTEAEEEHCIKQIKRILVGGAILFVIVLLSCLAVLAVPPIRVQPAPGQRGAVLTASDAGASDYYGRSCTLSSDGSVLAAGANYWDGAGGVDQGGMYIYDIANPRPLTINGKPLGTP